MAKSASLRASWVLVTLVASCATPTAGPRRIPTEQVVSTPVGPASDEASGVQVLSETARYVFAADGTKTFTYRLRYRIRTRDDLGAWAAVSATWSPWFQARPVLSARVTRADGQVFELDPTTVVERPVESGQEGIYTDRRKLEAPLPGLAAGAIVEHTAVQAELRPFAAAGSLDRFYFGMRAPVARSVLEIDIPEGLPLQYQLRGIDLTPDQSTKDGRTTLRFEVSDTRSFGPNRLLLPPEHPRYPHVVFTTARSWRAVARGFAQLVNGQIQGADVSALLTGLDRSQPRRAIIAELVRRMHAEIRYTGLELGEQAILPRPPNETLARRFGDCKDKGALLIALLDAAGIEANLAVLRSGFGEDIVPELPGMESFNHAIVYVPGPEPLWIDATADLLPVGEIPVQVQGRYALIIAEDGPGLLRVPEVEAGHNDYLEIRKVTFPDFGLVEVVERTEVKGEMEHRLRRQLLGSGRSRLEKSLGTYVRRAYRAERLGGFKYGDVRDVGAPFSVEVTAVDARVGYITRTEAKVQLRAPVLFGFIPDLLRDAGLGLSDGDAEDERKLAAALVRSRTDDLVLPYGFVARVRYEVEPPPGFVIHRLPETVRLSLGPGAYSLTSNQTEAGRVQVEIRVETGKRRYTAQEAQAFVLGLSKVWALDIPSLEFIHAGAKLLAAGDARGALEEYRRLARQEPIGPAHRARFAEALLEMGLGAAARKEAFAAAAAAPQSAPIQMALGRVLEHDLFGRPLASGLDHQGALEAYRRVLSLKPAHLGAQLSLARLLEHDDRGQPSRDLAAWKEAAAIYRSVRDQTGDTDHDGRLLLALFWARDFEGLHELASNLTLEPPTLAMQIVAASHLRGAEAALQEVEALRPPALVRQEALQLAALSLSQQRAYALARRITEAAVPGAEDPLKLQRGLASLSRVASVDLDSLSAERPEGAVQRLLYAMLTPPLDPARVRELFATRAFDADRLDEELAELTEGLSTFHRAGTRAEISIDMIRDNVLSLTRWQVDGRAADGFRVRGRFDVGKGGRESLWFVVRQGGAYRIRSSEMTPSALGEEALRLFRAKKLTGARRWLRWAADLMPDARPEDPLEVPPFVTLRHYDAPLDVQAASLIVMGTRARRAVAVLERARARFDEAAPRGAVDHALLLAYERLDETKLAREAAQRLNESWPKSVRAFAARCRTLARSGDREGATRFAAERLAELPKDPLAMTCLSEGALEAGDVAAARRWLGRQVELGVADAATMNNLAWLGLFGDGVTEEDVELALRSNAMTGFKDAAKLHTLAALYAEQGKVREAFQLFLKRMEIRGAEQPAPVDWYLLGRIMQHYDLPQMAVDAYERVERPDGRDVDSTYRLAARRLKMLRGTP